MKYTFYDATTGKIISSAIFGDQETADLNLANNSWVEGLWNESDYYVQDGQVIAKPANPSTNDMVYYFDYTTKSWSVLEDKRATNIRIKRNELLTELDRVNPVWYAALTTEQQQELQVYRQALLDVPQQSGFPTDTVWPSKPTWL